MAGPATVRRIALALPDTVERPSYGTPAFFVKKKLFARLLEDGDSVVIKVDMDQREVLLQANSKSFFITDHYRNYPMMIVRLSTVSSAELRELLHDAWSYASQ